MAEEEIRSWLASERSHYIEERARSGEERVQAVERADQEIGQLFPDGSPAPGQNVYRVLDDATVVGTLWVGQQYDAPPGQWWVYNIQIDEPYRGRGLGKATMLAAEVKARELGAARLGLNVFGHNEVARRLYEGLGYETQAIQMRKTL